MGQLAIIDPLPVRVDGSTLTGGERLVTPSPRETAVAGAAGLHFANMDFGGPVTLDTLFVGYTSLGDGAAFALSGGLAGGAEFGLGTALPIAATRLPRRRRHALVVLGTPVSLRYLSFSIQAPAGMELGVFAAGLAIRADREWGGGRQVVDTGVGTRTGGGGFGFSRGGRAGGFACTLASLDDATADEFYGLQLEAGSTRTVLVVEDPDAGPGLNEAIHWGRLAQLSPSERRAPQDTNWDLRVEDWA